MNDSVAGSHVCNAEDVPSTVILRDLKSSCWDTYIGLFIIGWTLHIWFMRLQDRYSGITYWYCADAKTAGDCSDRKGVGEAFELNVGRRASHDII
jgi:hypothetical protein